MRLFLLLLCFVFGVWSAQAETTITFNSKAGFKEGPRYVGSTVKKTETRKTDSIHSIEAGGGVALRIVDGPPSVQVSWDDNLVQFVATTVNNGALSVQVKMANDTGSITSHLPIEVVVSTPAPVRRASLSGGASASIERSAEKTVTLNASGGASLTALKLAVSQLNVEVSGGATVTLAGRAEQADFEVSAGATCKASDLKIQASRFDLSSGATAKVSVAQSATGEVSSGASLEVTGNPKVMHVETSSGGTVNGRSGRHVSRHASASDDDDD
jgi:Putative auto-transporter adhesin, head GIN domain